MDKYEFQLKVDEIESLVGEKNYAKAAEIADTINWRKVRNIATLMMVGEVYQQTRRYDDCKDLLLSAYERSPIGKKIIYRLAEIAIEEGADYMDVTHLGLGGKWRDGNLTMEYLLRRFGANPGYEATVIKNELIEQIIKYHKFTAAV